MKKFRKIIAAIFTWMSLIIVSLPAAAAYYADKEEARMICNQILKNANGLGKNEG